MGKGVVNGYCGSMHKNGYELQCEKPEEGPMMFYISLHGNMT